MIYAQIGRYVRRHLASGQSERQGASVANTEFLRAVVKYGSAEQIYMFAESVPIHHRNGQDSAHEELCQEWPGRNLNLGSIIDIPALVCERRDIVFYTPGVFIGAIGQLRRAVGARPFPICGLTHSLDVSMPYLFFPGAALFGESYDALVASSAAGYEAIERMWEEVGELLARMGSSPEQRRRPRVVRIPLGIELEEPHTTDKALSRRMLGIGAREKVLLYVGRLCERSKADLEPLLLVVRSVLRRHPDCLLLIAGREQDGSYARSIEAMARELGVWSRVRLLTEFPSFVKELVYAASDVFVSPVDNTQETFGLAVLEAMAAGLPVVASDWSGYRDLVVHGTTGYLVPTFWNSGGAVQISTVASVCSEAFRRRYLAERTVVDVRALHEYVEAVLDNEELRKRLGEAARRRAEEYSWKRIIGQHEELWAELLAESHALVEDHRRWCCENYDAVYRHFATTNLDRDMRVRRSALRRVGEEDEPVTRLSSGTIDGRHLQRVLSECPREGTAIGSLEEGDRSRMDAIAWLLKKGYLEIDASY